MSNADRIRASINETLAILAKQMAYSHDLRDTTMIELYNRVLAVQRKALVEIGG